MSSRAAAQTPAGPLKDDMDVIGIDEVKEPRYSPSPRGSPSTRAADG